MSTFSLRIGTTGRLLFEGDVERVVCRSIRRLILRFLRDTVTLLLLLEWGSPVSSWQMETDELRPVLEGCFLL